MFRNVRFVSIALVLGVLVACSKKSSNDTPTEPSNQNPTISAMSVSPGFGVSGLTTFTFNATATDPDGDAVTFNWQVPGAASSINESSSRTQTINGDGNVTVRVTVSDGKGGSATDTRTTTIGTMTGTWRLVLSPTACGGFPGDNGMFLNLTQSGGTVLGTISTPNGMCAATPGTTGQIDPAEPGTIDANGHVRIRIKVGDFTDFYAEGNMTSTGRTINATASHSGLDGYTVTMTKQ